VTAIEEAQCNHNGWDGVFADSALRSIECAESQQPVTNVRNSSQSNGAITVTRDASPFVGMFHGKQNAGSADHLSAQFACYPAHDSALPQENTFVCYVPEASSGGPNVSDAEKIPQ
jgi:hypothetical protein